MVLYGILVALSAVIVGVYAVWNLTVRPPEIPQEPDPAPPAGSGSQAAEPVEQEQPAGRQRREDVYNFVLLGRDRESANTDTIIVVSYDVANQKVGMISIPRDTAVNRDWRKDPKINGAYAGAGVDVLKEEIEQTFGIPIDYYIYVDLKGFVALVDELEGVDVYIPEEMNYDDPYQDLHIHQTKGYRLLSGSDVMQVLRYRHDTDSRYGYADGDLGRIKTQQSLLKAMIEQLLQLKNVTKIGDFARVVKNNVTSDLTFEEMLWFGSQAVMGGLKIENVNFVTMPNTNKSCYSRVYHRMQSYVTPNAQELLDLVNNELSPFVEKFTMRDLDIMSVNADGSVSSSTGHVEDSKAAQPQNHHSSSGSQTGTGDSGTTTDPGTATDPGNTGDNSGTTVDPGNTGDNSGGTTVDPGNTGDNSGTTTPSEPTTPVDPVPPTDPGTGESGTTGDNSGTTGSDEMPEWLRP